MFPFSGGANLIFDKYPGGIIIRSTRTGLKGILPTQVKFDQYKVSTGVPILKRYIGNKNIIGLDPTILSKE
jgi:hypothetical protein